MFSQHSAFLPLEHFFIEVADIPTIAKIMGAILMKFEKDLLQGLGNFRGTSAIGIFAETEKHFVQFFAIIIGKFDLISQTGSQTGSQRVSQTRT